MYHYVYLLTFFDGMRYVGAHSTKIKPELDTCYLGSGKALPPRSHKTCHKEILVEFQTREKAIAYEEAYIIQHECVESDHWYNLRHRVYDRHGSELSQEHRDLISKTHTGRDRSGYGRRYSGAGRTPAQRAGDIAAGLKIRGTKNPDKGREGVENGGFSPWYYITPDDQYVEVHDRTKQEMALELGFTPRQLGHGLHHTNQHIRATTLPRKGWTFGNLPRPTDLDGD